MSDNSHLPEGNDLPEGEKPSTRPSDGAERLATTTVRDRIVRLLMNLVSVAESHWTRLAVKRAVDAALPAGLTGDELEIPAAESDRIVMWLEDAADRLELRLAVQRLPFSDAFDFVLHHPPSALLSTPAPDRSWLT